MYVVNQQKELKMNNCAVTFYIVFYHILDWKSDFFILENGLRIGW